MAKTTKKAGKSKKATVKKKDKSVYKVDPTTGMPVLSVEEIEKVADGLKATGQRLTSPLGRMVLDVCRMDLWVRHEQSKGEIAEDPAGWLRLYLHILLNIMIQHTDVYAQSAGEATKWINAELNKKEKAA